MTTESKIEQAFIEKLTGLKYTYRPDIRDKAALEHNFRQKFEALNRVHLTEAEFARLRDEIITADVFTAAQALREKGKFTRSYSTSISTLERRGQPLISAGHATALCLTRFNRYAQCS